MSRIAAFFYGTTAYLVFLGTILYAIGFVGGMVVPKTIDSGSVVPLGEALAINVLLMSLFAVQHSVMARKPFKRWWTQYVPHSIERSTYVLLASLALLLLFWQWRPMPAVVWQVADPRIAAAVTGLSHCGWLLVLTSTFLINHFELFGLHQVVNNLAGRSMPPVRFKTPVIYKVVRHPIYAAYVLAFGGFVFSHPALSNVVILVVWLGVQILRIQAGHGDWDQTKTDVFSEEFLLSRPLLTAIRRTEPTVLLIDETDKADIEIEGLLLEVLSDFAVTVPELGTITAERTPFVLLTSNATRELSEALKRRCLFLHIDFPDPDLERRILLSRVPELPEHLAEELVKIIGVLRGMQLKKLPSVAETIDWGRTVLALGMDTIDDELIAATLGVVLKHQSDQVKASGELRLN